MTITSPHVRRGERGRGGDAQPPGSSPERVVFVLFRRNLLTDRGCGAVMYPSIEQWLDV